MKKIILVQLLIVLFVVAQAQKREKVQSIIKVKRDAGYFTEQEKLWQIELDKDKTNAEAWYNIYMAKRMKRIVTGNWEEKFDSFIDEMGKNIPNSFEYNFTVYYEGGNNFDLFPYLEKAHKIDPKRIEAYSDLTVYYLGMNNQKEFKDILKMWYDKKDFEEWNFIFNYNEMESTKNNSILFVYGDNTTFPKWMLQEVLNIRTDIQIVNVGLLMMDVHRKMMFNKLNIEQPMSPEDFYTKKKQ
jgi:hypothetical protein